MLKKILLTSQSFGFGPVSKLNVIAKYLKAVDPDLSFDFVGDGVSLNFIKNNSNLYDSIINFADFKNEDFKEYSLVISVMEPDFVFRARENGLKYIYIDSLFWFWEWEGLDINNFNVDSLVHENSNNEPHYKQYFAHKFSEKSFIQTFGEHKFTDSYKKSLNFQDVGYIIDSNFKTSNHIKKNLLLSFSGQISPVNNVGDSINYINFVLDLLKNYLTNLSKKYNIIITINSILLNNPQLNQSFKYVSLNNTEFLKTLNDSVLILAPSGLTTIFESLNYEIPIIFLPEQHYNHFENYKELLKNSNLDIPRFQEIFPNLLINNVLNLKDSSLGTQEIKNFYNKTNYEYLNISNNILKNIFNKNFEDNVENINKNQSIFFKSISKINFSTDGIKMIYDEILSLASKTYETQ